MENRKAPDISFVENTVDGIFIYQDERLKFANNRLSEISGYSVSELTSENFPDLFPPNTFDKIQDRLEKVLSGKPVPFFRKTVFPHKDGYDKEFRVTYSLIEYEGRRAVMGIAREYPGNPTTNSALFKKAAKQDPEVREHIEELVLTNSLLSQTVEQLADSEEKYRAIYENAQDAMFILDGNGNFISANNTAARYMGLVEEEMTGKNVHNFFPPQVADYYIQSVKKVIHQQEPLVTPEEKVPFEDGFKWFSTILTPFYTRRINKECALCVARDVTEQKLAEDALRETELKLRSLVNNMQDIVMTIDFDGRILGINRLVTDKVDRKTVIGASQFDFIHPDYHDQVKETISRVLETGEMGKYTILGVGPSGKMDTWYETRIVPDYEVGEMVSLSLITTDITERKKAENALRESEEKFRNIVEQSKDGIAILQDFVLKYCNPSLAEMVGYSPGEVIDTPFTNYIHPDELSRVTERHRKRLAGKKFETNYETALLKTDGSRLDVEINATLISYQGKPAVFVFVHDITEHKIAERKLIGYQARLRSMASDLSLTEQRERQRIAAELHDNIGQSLALTKMKLDEIKKQIFKSGLKQEFMEIYELVKNSITETRSVVYDLSPPILSELGLEAAIESMVENFHNLYGISYTYNNDNTPKILDNDIQILLFQATRELMLNVIKHAEARQVEINIELEDNRIVITVQDDGKGFNLAEQRPQTGKTAGFGLFSIKERLHHLDGQMSISTSPGKGTRVVLTAPASPGMNCSGE